MTFSNFRIRIRPEHIALLRQERIQIDRNAKYTGAWLKPGIILSITAPITIEPYSCFRRGPNFFSMGSFSFSRSALPARASVGRYCSIAGGVSVMEVDHPIHHLSTSSIGYLSKQAVITQAARDRAVTWVKPMFDRPDDRVTIGNDVWIGSDVLFKRGITVGDGAVIAARSIVTRDVPPYAIVAGAPAQIKRLRFPEEIVARLIATRWWDHHFVDFGPTVDLTDPARFLEWFEPRKADIPLWSPKPTLLHEAFRAISAGLKGNDAPPEPAEDESEADED